MHKSSHYEQVSDRFPLTQTIISNIVLIVSICSLLPFLIVPSELYLFELDDRLERSIFRRINRFSFSSISNPSQNSSIITSLSETAARVKCQYLIPLHLQYLLFLRWNPFHNKLKVILYLSSNGFSNQPAIRNFVMHGFFKILIFFWEMDF